MIAEKVDNNHFDERTSNLMQIKKLSKLEKVKTFIENLSEEQKIKFWIKTLFSSYATIPKIIETIDNIVELQASTISFVSDVYNHGRSSMGQVEKIIDLGDRKNNLLNIYIMTQNLYKSLSKDDIELVEKKYLDGYSNENLAKELGISSRTVYRRLDCVIDKVYEFCERQKWSLKFIYSQVRKEDWIKDRYIKIVSEYCRNNNYFEDYNMSSSSL